MLFRDFGEIVKPEYFGYSVQALYLKELFSAAGIMRLYSDSHLTSVFNGQKPFSGNIKKQFKKPVDVAPIAAFFADHIEQKWVETIVDAFGIPKSIERNAKYISGALAEQIKVFIESTTEDAPIVVPEEYEKQQIKTETAHYEITKRLYTNDDVWVEGSGKTYDVAYYEQFDHTWVIHNNGKVLWKGRKLVFVNAKEVSPTAEKLEIIIPETAPFKIAKISTRFDARGDEDKYICKWEMQDADGNNCFPDSRWVFDVTVNVEARF